MITVTSPAEGETYGATVSVTGTVTDDFGQVIESRLVVPLAEVDQRIALGEDGVFAVEFSTAGISEPILLTLIATDWNANTTSTTVSLFNDEAGPHIVITEPEDFSAYPTVVRVSGTITDGADLTTTVEVASARWSIPGTGYNEAIELGDEGSFSFEFVTRDDQGTQVIDGPSTIEIVAEDHNGNQSTADCTIVRSQSGDFSLVTVIPGKNQVTIEWDPVLHGESYSIFESMYGETRTGVTSPYLWEGLENGEVYAFQVSAHIPDHVGEDAYSSVIEKMPLSARDLAPWVREVDYRSVTMEWWQNPNVEMYTVERSLSADGLWEIRRNLTANVFVDMQLDHDTEYHYRIRPAGYPDIVSAPGSAVPSRFDTGVSSVRDTTGTARGVVVAGSYAYVADYGSGLAIIRLWEEP